MPDSADYKFLKIEEDAERLDKAVDKWDSMTNDEKVLWYQDNFSDEHIVDLLENDDDIMESIYAELVAIDNQQFLMNSERIAGQSLIWLSCFFMEQNMKCFCDKELIWGGDHDYEDYGLDGSGIVSNLSCQNEEC